MLFSVVIAAVFSLLIRNAPWSFQARRNADRALWCTVAVWCLLLTGTVSAASPQVIVLCFIAAYIWHRVSYGSDTKPGAQPVNVPTNVVPFPIDATAAMDDDAEYLY